MKNPLRRRAAVVIACVLASTLGALPAMAEEGDGKGSLRVTILDPTGAPVDAQLFLMKQGAGPGSGGLNGVRVAPGTFDFVDVPAARYGAYTMSPWGGMTCAGIDPCDYFGLQAEPSPVSGAVTVDDVETPARLTIRLAPPAAVSGSRVIGQRLRVTWSPQMATMIAELSASGGIALPTVQWLRNGVVIPHELGVTYETTRADLGRVLSVRLSYPAGSFWDHRSEDWSPRTVVGGRIAKITSGTTVDVFRKKVLPGRTPGIRVEVSAGNLPATGRVRMKLGRLTVTKTLRNGSARLAVPRSLKPRRYRVVATYLGSWSSSPSTGTGTFKVVRRR
ncbi:hypothetical protein SAMN05421872_102288 [Nocardioides lianchengensis]|uniref:Ig-like domain (Group 3) n=2 Tax=Nocardioides lianchengensis TaxID=1045774 RepID=A0A1G6LMN6_9ACTN|nr:hypothetical protein SAMN05421872_102288 [Nocardioides lianchengensis]